VNILIVGATGNLGSHIARHLLNGPHRLRLLVHKTPLPRDLAHHPNVTFTLGDLDQPASLHAATAGINCIVYVAGVLFEPRPERFLRRTNTIYVKNIVDAALRTGVERFILISFPHIEENTTPDSPAMGRLDVQPKSIHARTRLEAEKYLFSACQNKSTNPIVLRAGVIYGREVKLVEAARKLMRYGLFAIWPSPTWVHLLALPDFLTSVEIAIERVNLSGIYNLCDDCPVTLQEFLDALAAYWGYRKPRRLPAFCFQWAASFCELFAALLHARTPLTRDMIQMGMTSVVADTSRMKQEIRRGLLYPTFRTGLLIL
jgi:nucleoside-diphosphate-sugar epimerase